MFTTKNLFTIAGKHFLIALASILIAVVTVSYISAQITAVANKTAKNRHVAESLSEQTTLYANLKNETAIIGTNDQVIKNAFIPSDNILGFVTALEKLASSNNLTEAFHFSTPTASPIATSFTLQIITYQNTISSNLPTLINYLRGFENLPYFTKIDSLNISSGATDWRTSSNTTFTATVAAQLVQ